MKKVLFSVFFAMVISLTLHTAVFSQDEDGGVVDYWATQQECLAVLHDPSVPFYKPSLISKRNGKFVPSSLRAVRGLPENKCLDMDLPDRMLGRGWVKVAAGEEMVYEYRTNNTIGRLLTMKRCNNDVYGSASSKQVATQAPNKQDQRQDQSQSQSVVINAPERCKRSNTSGPNNSLLLQEQCAGEDPIIVRCIMNCQAPPVVTVAKEEKKGSGFGKFMLKHVLPNALSFAGGVLVGRWVWKDNGYIWVN